MWRVSGNRTQVKKIDRLEERIVYELQPIEPLLKDNEGE